MNAFTHMQTSHVSAAAAELTSPAKVLSFFSLFLDNRAHITGSPTTNSKEERNHGQRQP